MREIWVIEKVMFLSFRERKEQRNLFEIVTRDSIAGAQSRNHAGDVINSLLIESSHSAHRRRFRAGAHRSNFIRKKWMLRYAQHADYFLDGSTRDVYNASLAHHD